MHNERKIFEDIYYIGASDRRLAKFENAYPIPNGVSYNSYLICDDKTVLLDTVDKSVSVQFFENVDYVLNGKQLDYVVVNHMEPDHAATLSELILRFPNVKIICNAKTVPMLKNFFDFDVESKTVVVNEGDTFETKNHSLAFVMAPMVHWPEVMVTYDAKTKTLFSADAFGTFGALNGNIFADELDFFGEWIDDARRYYTNIVGKYGAPVQAVLKKAAGLDIKCICPLHGPIWRNDIEKYIDKYQHWSTYTPEDNTAVIFYGSIYGNTQNIAEIFAAKLADKGVKNIKMYDVSSTDVSVCLSECFRASHLVFASATYNGGIFTPMENLINDLRLHGLKNRKVVLIENGSWAPTTVRQMNEIISKMGNMEIFDENISVRSSIKNEQMVCLEKLADEFASSILQN